MLLHDLKYERFKIFSIEVNKSYYMIETKIIKLLTLKVSLNMNSIWHKF